MYYNELRLTILQVKHEMSTDSFTPHYDADGNQTLIQTSTGIWSVTYNAENRPVRWESGDTVVTMDLSDAQMEMVKCKLKK